MTIENQVSMKFHISTTRMLLNQTSTTFDIRLTRILYNNQAARNKKKSIPEQTVVTISHGNPKSNIHDV